MHVVLKRKKESVFKGKGFKGFVACWAMVNCPVEVFRHLGEMSKFCCLWRGYTCFRGGVYRVVCACLGGVCAG